MLGSTAARAAADDDITAVSSRVSDDYVRAKLANGSFPIETYAFGEGGKSGEAGPDVSLDKLKFLDVARTIAAPLANQNYLPTKDPKETRLLIMVYWGRTAGVHGASGSAAYQNLSAANQHVSSARSAAASAAALPHGGPATVGAGGSSEQVMAAVQQEAADAEFASALAVTEMENRQRDKADWKNAGVLGYDTDLAESKALELTPLRMRHQDLIDDLEDDRYFVVLMAYDFQLMWKEKKPKLLWETRFSIRERGNAFDQQLAAMAQYASQYFGQNSRGLIREPLREGEVKVGTPTVVEDTPVKK